MKKFIPILALCVWIFPAYSMYAAEEFDLCDNFEGIQATMPANHSSVGSPGQCYELQAPVTIDLAQPGEAPVTIDVNPVDSEGKAGPAQTIDVNPQGMGQTAITASSTASDGTVVELSTTTPRTITSLAELNAYVFDPETKVADRIIAIENHVKGLMQQLIDVLIAEIERLIAEKEAEETATTTPSVL